MPLSTPQSNRIDLRVGSTVNLPGGAKGLIQFIGSVDGKPGDYAGVEMLAGYEAHGKHNGEFGGVQYFTVSKPNTGVFVSLAKLRGNNMGSTKRLTASRPSLLVPRGSPSSEASPTRRSAIPGSPSELAASRKFGASETPKRSGVRNLSMLNGTPRRASALVPPNAVLNPPSHSTAQGLPANSPRRRVSNLYGRATSNSSVNSGSSVSSAELNELKSRISTLTAELEDARSSLALKETQLDDQAFMIRDMEVALNEVQEILRANQPDPDLDVEALRQSVIDKENKISSMKNEHEQKRQEFRENIQYLEEAMRQRDEEYENHIKELHSGAGLSTNSAENDARVLELEKLVGGLEAEIVRLNTALKNSELAEKNTRVQLSRLAEVENRLIDKEQEAKDLSESIKDYKEMLENSRTASDSLPQDEATKQLQESLEYEKSRSSSLEQKLGEEVEQLTLRIDALSKSNQSLEEKYEEEKQAKDKLRKENQEMAALLEEKSSKESDLEKRLERLQIRSSSSSTTASTSTPPVPQTPTAGLLKSPISTNEDTGFQETPLPIYKSPTKVDPTAGREMWCGLCERHGHESLDCPYEETEEF